MAPRRTLGCLVVALSLCTWTACGKGDVAQAGAGGLDKRCEQLGKVCGDKEKHVGKVVEECKQAAKLQVDKGCTDKALAAYDCYEKELCGNLDKVWTLDDLRVLADRHNKCVAERTAIRECTEK